MVSWLKKKLGFSCFKMPRNSETMGKHTLRKLVPFIVNDKTTKQRCSLKKTLAGTGNFISLLVSAYTPCEGLIGNISLKVMTYAPYCAQFTHHDREKNIFLSHNPYLSQ